MKKHYLAVTYDVCEHLDLYEDMNEYILDGSVAIDEQVLTFAELDVAPLVKVYESTTTDFTDRTLYKEYSFKTYECGCTC